MKAFAEDDKYSNLIYLCYTVQGSTIQPTKLFFSRQYYLPGIKEYRPPTNITEAYVLYNTYYRTTRDAFTMTPFIASLFSHFNNRETNVIEGINVSVVSRDITTMDNTKSVIDNIEVTGFNTPDMSVFNETLYRMRNNFTKWFKVTMMTALDNHSFTCIRIHGICVWVATSEYEKFCFKKEMIETENTFREQIRKLEAENKSLRTKLSSFTKYFAAISEQALTFQQEIDSLFT
jgi:hypothetical protein